MENNERNKEIGNRIKAALKARGMTQRQLAPVIAMSTTNLNKIIQGHTALTYQNALLISKALKVPASYLMLETDFMNEVEELQNFVNESERTEKEWKAIEGIQSRYGLEKVPPVNLTGSEVDAGLMQVQANGKIYFCTEYDYNKMRSDVYKFIKSRTEDFVRDLKRINNPDLIELSTNLTALQTLKDKLQS